MPAQRVGICPTRGRVVTVILKHHSTICYCINEIVDEINHYVMSLMSGDSREYLSADSYSWVDVNVEGLNELISV